MSSTSQVITVLIVDDQGLVRDGFTRIVDAQPAMRVVGVASNGREAIALARARRPDVILMDVRMPGVDGIEATRTIVQEDGSIRVLGLTIFDPVGSPWHADGGSCYRSASPAQARGARSAPARSAGLAGAH